MGTDMNQIPGQAADIATWVLMRFWPIRNGRGSDAIVEDFVHGDQGMPMPQDPPFGFGLYNDLMILVSPKRRIECKLEPVQPVAESAKTSQITTRPVGSQATALDTVHNYRNIYGPLRVCGVRAPARNSVAAHAINITVNHSFQMVGGPLPGYPAHATLRPQGHTSTRDVNTSWMASELHFV